MQPTPLLCPNITAGAVPSEFSEYGAIFIGKVNASALAKTRMAKSVLDAGWSLFRTMLQYQSDDAGVWFDEGKRSANPS